MYLTIRELVETWVMMFMTMCFTMSVVGAFALIVWLVLRLFGIN